MGKNHFFHKHRVLLKAAARVIFGLVWLVDGAFKFQPGETGVFTQLIGQQAGQQPAWLLPWFNFWTSVVAGNPAFWVYLVGGGEVLLGLGLIFGVMRKTTYVIGFFLSLLIWAVPEGFGGPYGPSSTDIGTGVIYALVFVMLMMINTGYGPSKYSLDIWLEKKIKWWKKIAEFN